jgi:hypothetical protein
MVKSGIAEPPAAGPVRMGRGDAKVLFNKDLKSRYSAWGSETATAKAYKAPPNFSRPSPSGNPTVPPPSKPAPAKTPSARIGNITPAPPAAPAGPAGGGGQASGGKVGGNGVSTRDLATGLDDVVPDRPSGQLRPQSSRRVAFEPTQVRRVGGGGGPAPPGPAAPSGTKTPGIVRQPSLPRPPKLVRQNGMRYLIPKKPFPWAKIGGGIMAVVGVALTIGFAVMSIEAAMKTPPPSTNCSDFKKRGGN